MHISKEMFGWISIVLCIVGYLPYLKLILERKVKPHIFSWFTWCLVCLIIFAAQWQKGAGWGAWATGLSGLFFLLFAVLSFSHGNKTITRSDWVCFIVSLAAIPLWQYTNDPLYSVILLCLIDALACFPTFRKSWHQPHEESAYSFSVSGLKFLVSFFAINSITLTTGLFPLTSVILNTGIVAVILGRRWILQSYKISSI